MFHTHTCSCQMHLRKQLQCLSKDSFSILEYFDKKPTIAYSLHECLVVILDSDCVDYILYDLGSAYGSFRAALSMQNKYITYDDLLNILLQEEQRLEDDSRQLEVVAPEAHSTSRFTNNYRSNDTSLTQNTDQSRSKCQIYK